VEGGQMIYSLESYCSQRLSPAPGLSGVVDDLRGATYTDQIEQILAAYTPNEADVPALIQDLQRVVNEMYLFLQQAPSMSSNAFLSSRETVYQQILPQLMLKSKIIQVGIGTGAFFNYHAMLVNAERIWNRIAVAQPGTMEWENLMREASSFLGTLANAYKAAIPKVADAVSNFLDRIIALLPKVAIYGTGGVLGLVILNKLLDGVIFRRKNPLLMQVNPLDEEKKNYLTRLSA
jgi:hypothetical protein